MGSEVAEEDGDLDGVSEVGVADVELIEGSRRNGVGIEDFFCSSLRGQGEFEGVETFASGSKRSDAILHTWAIRECEQVNRKR